MTAFKAKSLIAPKVNGTTIRVKKEQVESINTILLDLAKKMIDEGYEPIKFTELADIVIKLGLKEFSSDDFMNEIRKQSNS